ncbi:hypothetical protein A3J20_06655 [Candidatus Gottesmanbacteria bacterium RIFCSPLOWO2_02_FULL_42_29]|uniref:riboflavin kinase n=2 Tax=Candidatus Gottesmaniibacteriota TaxID=1752720 RepID=A0A1F6BKM1_9BACT|nr:MAG: Riboflavin biosynthesis protein RibF [Candidatus Gottesmanbacteria bacterium GW2011_GWA2_42_18]KKS75859.1 MAG: Riboflavin biosynthesis protein RibF [Candidatus Gottesmanbacteria bacterium GW2011_GWC2_42_8]OGG09445.1 MAG: hypothetical protein A2781_01650 [Candidatus Gottesmanbacteria bacterium RIFCSPHIGHO2_01_FULL_42_27]OGG19533.1 MAG: hypothetical protein A3E72_02585 [Candidatus Gottesmanbacteria bacterium RIFCSPHIGHO2_12_FULL_43_26]OGG35884.1 MAG: hypothetical protein A3G68_02400 [Cand
MSVNFPSKSFKAQVIHGRKMGKKFGFPTINLDNPRILSGFNNGVYAASVAIEGKNYQGLLYKGPRLILGETETILEIYLLDFDRDIYGQCVSFKLLGFLRGVIHFPDTEAYKEQLKNDINTAQKIFRTSKD